LAAARVNLPDEFASLLAATSGRRGRGGRRLRRLDINGLVFDRHQEEERQVFTGALRVHRRIPGRPLGAPLVPNWARIWAGMPEAGVRLLAAVQAMSELAHIRRASWSGA
jgi:hypothetical protein